MRVCGRTYMQVTLQIDAERSCNVDICTESARYVATDLADKITCAWLGDTRNKVISNPVHDRSVINNHTSLSLTAHKSNITCLAYCCLNSAFQQQPNKNYLLPCPVSSINAFTLFVGRQDIRPVPKNLLKLEMWANAQRNGCPAEHRWRPLFNAAKFG